MSVNGAAVTALTFIAPTGPAGPIDSFDGPSFDPVWTTVGADAVIDTGRARLALVDTYTGVLLTGHDFSLSGKSAFVQVTIDTVADPPVDQVDVAFFLRQDLSTIGFVVYADILYIWGTAAGNFELPYDPVAHAWWRVAETAGTLSWDASPDGSTWATITTDDSPPDLTGFRVELQTGRASTSGGPYYAWFDNLNVNLVVAATALTFTAPALGTRTVPGSAATALSFTAPAVGTVTAEEVTGVAATALTFAAPAAGARSTFAAAAATLTFAAPATGTRTVAGAAATAPTFDAPAAATRAVSGAATTTLAFAAPAFGTVTAEEVTGAASTALTFAGPASGTRTVPGAATTALTFAAPAVGTRAVAGAATTALTFTAPASGTGTVLAAAATVLTFAAPATGRGGVVHARATSARRPDTTTSSRRKATV